MTGAAALSRVALITSSYHPHVGGVEEHVRNLARELRSRGHAVEVWTVDRGEHLGEREVDGVRVRYLPSPLPTMSPRGVASFAAAAPRAWRAWQRARKDFEPDILHTQCFGPNGLYALALHRVSGTPMIISSHGETFADDHHAFDESRLLRTGLTRSLRDAEAVTACSRTVLDDLASRFGLGSGLVVPNGVDLEETPEPAPGPPSESNPTVLGLGRMERNKGFDLVLRAFAAAALPPPTQLLLAGDGGELPTLRALAMELGVADRVTFPGRLARPEVVDAVASATVVVVPSRVEAFGIVVLEAWRAGTPLIATTRGGPGDLVTHGVNGMLVDPTDVDALARTLTAVMGDPELRGALAAGGLATVTTYGWSEVADRYIELYDRVIA